MAAGNSRVGKRQYMGEAHKRYEQMSLDTLGTLFGVFAYSLVSVYAAVSVPLIPKTILVYTKIFHND